MLMGVRLLHPVKALEQKPRLSGEKKKKKHTNTHLQKARREQWFYFLLRIRTTWRAFSKLDS